MEKYKLLPRLVSEIQMLIEDVQNMDDASRFPASNRICFEQPTHYSNNDSRQYINKLKREVYYLWEFIVQNGDRDEAKEYLEENMDYEIPFEWE